MGSKNNIDLKDKIFSDIKNKIINNYYKPGEKLSEDKLKEEYGVSRTPIREALIKLQDRKLVNVVHRGVNCVSQIDIIYFKDIYEAKSYILKNIVRMAIEKDNNDIIKGFRKVIENEDAYGSCQDIESLLKLNAQINNILIDTCKNSEMKHIYESINEKYKRYINYYLAKLNKNDVEELRNIIYNIHHGLFSCIKERDIKKAEKLIKEHYSNMLSFIRSKII